MASKEKELEERLREVGDRLANPPSAVGELRALLNQTESLLMRVEQSPSQSISNAIGPAVTALAAKVFLEHSDLDVKVGLASCISEITRITAPEAPYDDNLMKKIFERIVETFECLDDISSRVFAKRVSILETLARVRSCVVMLDLECDDLILKMFQHFFKTIKPVNARMVFSSMETIMALVLEESEDISPELISCLLENVKIDNEDILPVARELGEKVISSCATKIKPYLSELCKSMNLTGYGSVVVSICHDAPDVLEQKELAASGAIMADDSKQSEQTISDELHKGTGKVEQEVDCAEEVMQEKVPEQGTSNDGNNSTVEPSPKQKSERQHHGGKPRKTDAVGKKKSSGLEPVDEDPNSISVPVAKKVKGRPVSSLRSLKKEHDNHSLVDGTPANDVEGCMKNPVVADNGNLKASLSTEVGTSDTAHRKRGRPNSKLPSKEGGDSGISKHRSSALQKGTETNNKTISSKNDSKKESDGGIHSKQRSLLHDDEKEPSSTAKAEPSDAPSPSRDKPSKQSSTQKQKSSDKHLDKPKPKKDRSSEPSLKEMMSSGKKAHKTQVDIEERVKSSSKRVREAEEESPDTRDQHKELDESLVGSRIKVWWPDDKRYYQGTVETYYPSSKKHKILYDDGDIEILLLKRERWILLENDHKKKQAKDNPIPDASSEEPQSKRTKTSSSSGSKEQNRGTESDPPKRKGRPRKGVSLAEDRSNESKFATKKDAGTKSSLAEDIPGDSSKAIGKATTKYDVAEDSPSDSIEAIGRSGTTKDVGTKSSLPVDSSGDLSKAIERSGTKKDVGTKSSLAIDSPGDPGKAIGKSGKKDVGTKSSLAVDSSGDRSKAIGKSGTKKDAATKSKTGSKLNDDAENTRKIGSNTMGDAGRKGRKEVLREKLNKESPAADRKPKISGPIRDKASKKSEPGS